MKTLGLSVISLIVFLSLVGVVSGIVALVSCPYWAQVAALLGTGR